MTGGGRFPVAIPFSAGVQLAGMANVTQILAAIEQGDPQAPEQLLPLVYDECADSRPRNWPTNGPARPCRRPRWCMRHICG